jgi:hypothetical protein
LGQKRIIFHSQRTYGLLIIQMYRWSWLVHEREKMF